MELNYSPQIKDELFAAFDLIKSNKVVERIFKKDFTLWANSPAEISNRLGWLKSPVEMKLKLKEITEFVDELKKENLKTAVLLGMGGSSLAAEVFQNIFYNPSESPVKLVISDSTHPLNIKFIEESIDLNSTLFIVSTKSGGTVETLSMMNFFYNRLFEKFNSTKKTGSHFIAITDPGSKLVSIAEKLNFRKIFKNNPNIGGRFSALSYFGLIPAAMVGANTEEILSVANEISNKIKNTPSDSTGNIGATLGALMGILANKGYNKLTLFSSPSTTTINQWTEQLIAESTGKEGKGILPVLEEEITFADYFGKDRFAVFTRFKFEERPSELFEKLKLLKIPFAEITLETKEELGATFFLWEFATSIAGWFLKIHPFNQPNVEFTKKAAREMVTEYLKKGYLPQPSPCFENEIFRIVSPSENKFESAGAAIKNFFLNYKGYSYLSLHSYSRYSNKINNLILQIRFIIQKKFNLTTTFGYGPRFLHSTGQLHKGDSGKGLFIQFFEDERITLPIPDEPTDKKSSISFNTLIKAQSLGDRQALLKAKRKVLRIESESSNFEQMLVEFKNLLEEI